MRVVFEEATQWREKGGKCSHCGKRMSQRKTFCHTVNPFNRNAAGVPKTRSEVFEDVRAIANEWLKEPLLHEKCKAEAKRAAS